MITFKICGICGKNTDTKNKTIIEIPLEEGNIIQTYHLKCWENP